MSDVQSYPDRGYAEAKIEVEEAIRTGDQPRLDAALKKAVVCEHTRLKLEALRAQMEKLFPHA